MLVDEVFKSVIFILIELMLIIILWGLKDNVYLFLKKILDIIYEFLDDCGVWGCVGIIVNFIFINYGGKWIF